MIASTERLAQALGGMAEATGTSAGQLQAVMQASHSVLDWVNGLEDKLSRIDGAAERTRESNGTILHIAREVHILAINANIEAARAGEAGKGFAVIANAINALSDQTAQAATLISQTVKGLAAEIAALRAEANGIAAQSRDGLTHLTRAEAGMGALSARAAEGKSLAGAIAGDAEHMRDVMADFGPTFDALLSSVETQATTVGEARTRVSALIRQSETMVQGLVENGGASDDQPLIDAVKLRAARISSLFEDAIAQRRISLTDLFSTAYRDIPGTNPLQKMASFTRLTDSLLPPIQEEALTLDPRIVFCAAVDRNGYLPTHNRKFSHPQGKDPVWNTANCRNRRMFDDRVGLGAGRSTAPFLMQLYRRDMGGGQFAMMKDVSAPIFVQGRHWGGLRLAYTLSLPGNKSR
jgi:methyl-accepting chemotaxis protein